MRRPLLVVGASGPLGQAIYKDLSRESREIIAVSRSGPVGLDYTDREAARSLLETVRPSSVVHLARSRIPEARDADDLGAFAEICAESGVERLVFASSAAVYGTRDPRPLAEDRELNPETPYALMKLESERVLVSAAHASGIAAICLRVFNVYGPGFHDSLINRLLSGSEPEMYLTSDFVRDYIHADDVVRAFRLAIEYPDQSSAIVNVGTGVGLSNEALVALFPTMPYRALKADDTRSFSIADPAFATSLLSFTAERRIADLGLYPALGR